MYVRSDKMKNTHKEVLLHSCQPLPRFSQPLVGSLVYWRTPTETPCQDIPKGTVILALAFPHAGKNMETGKYQPGMANKRIADKLEECARRFQRADSTGHLRCPGKRK